MSNFTSRTRINPLFLEKSNNRFNIRVNPLVLRSKTRNHVSTILNYLKEEPVDQSNKMSKTRTCELSKTRYSRIRTQKIKNLIFAENSKLGQTNIQDIASRAPVMNTKSVAGLGQVNITLNDKEEDCDLLKKDNISLMLKNAEEFIRNSLASNQTKEAIDKEAIRDSNNSNNNNNNNNNNNKRQLEPDIQNIYKNQKKKEATTNASFTSNCVVQQRSNAKIKQIISSSESSIVKSHEMITKSSQISEMLKNAEVFIRNSLDLASSAATKNKTAQNEPAEKIVRNHSRNRNKGYIETRISQKIANSSLPVVNYSKLTIDLRLRK